MIQLTHTDDNTPGAWFDHVVLGQAVRFKVRPRSMETIQRIRAKHRSFEWVHDDTMKDRKTGEAMPRMVKTAVYDEDAIFADVIDWIIEDFSGFGDQKRAPLPPTKINKNAIVRIAPLDGEISVLEFITARADELALSIAEDGELEIKN